MKLTLEVPLKDVLELLKGLDIDEVAVKTTDVPVVDVNPVVATEMSPNPTRRAIPTVDESWKDDLMYQPEKGKRRDHLQIAKGAKELELKRLMTPDEEAEVQFIFNNRTKKTEEAVEKMEAKQHADEMAKEILAENAAEEKLNPIPQPEVKEETSVPRTDGLSSVDKMFAS